MGVRPVLRLLISLATVWERQRAGEANSPALCLFAGCAHEPLAQLPQPFDWGGFMGPGVGRPNHRPSWANGVAAFLSCAGQDCMVPSQLRSNRSEGSLAPAHRWVARMQRHNGTQSREDAWPEGRLLLSTTIASTTREERTQCGARPRTRWPCSPSPPNSRAPAARRRHYARLKRAVPDGIAPGVRANAHRRPERGPRSATSAARTATRAARMAQRTGGNRASGQSATRSRSRGGAVPCTAGTTSARATGAVR